MQNNKWDKGQAGIKIAGRDINNHRYADNIILRAEQEEELKSLLMSEKGEWKTWHKTQHVQKDTASGPITSWQTERGKVKTVADFLFLGSKITVDSDFSHEIKRCVLLGRKAMKNLDSILKAEISLPTKVHIVKAVVFPVVIYGCESWTIKKTEHQRIDAFELWCWRRLLRVPWTARRSNHSFNPKGNQLWIYYWMDWCWSANILATQCKKLTHWKTPWCWERLKVKEGSSRGWDG